MKKILIFSFLVAIIVTFTSCSDSTTDPVTPDTGNLVVNSTPAGAKIFLDGTDSGFSTPHTFSAKDVATYTVKLQLENYADTTENAVVVKDQNTTLDITLTPLYSNFTARIYETTGTNASQPSGLILSTGMAVSSTNTDIDIYYYSSSDGTSYLVQSASLKSTPGRTTFFNVTTGTNLNDGADSGVKNSSWVNKIADDVTTVVFLYDNDGHYSKIKMTRAGGTGAGDPSYEDITWIYNKAKDNTKF
jgi:hypothetical protein